MTLKPGQLALRRTFNPRLTLSVLLIAISQFNFGFDQQGFSQTQAMDTFERQFGTYNSKLHKYGFEPKWLSLFNSLNYIPFGAGILIGSWVSKHFGRRTCMFSMSIWALISATIVITAQNRDHLMAGRNLNYIYIGMELSVVPIYQSEITPNQARGFVVGTYQVSLVLGALIMNLICRGTSTIQSNASWRIPLGLFYVIPTIVATLVWIVPESPRWLIAHGRMEDALNALTKLREGKFSQEEIELEFNIIRTSAEQALKEQKGSFFEQFNRKNFRRTFIVVMINFFLQATGQLFTTIYGAVYVKSLGTVNPFNITVIISVVNLSFGILSMFLIEKLGRRRLLMIGASIQFVALLTMGALGTVRPLTASLKAGVVAMMVIFSIGFATGFAGISHTLSAEIPNTTLRDMSYRTCSIVNIVMQFAVSFSLPYLLYAPYANLGSKVGFIFASMAFLSIVFTFFFVPEVRGRSLEEIDKLFASGTPARKFRDAVVTEHVELTQSGVKAQVLHVEPV